VRNKQDFYPTPAWCVDLILKELNVPSGHVWFEPCVGDGTLYDKLPTPKDYAEIAKGRDYLDPKKPYLADIIITNPPFSLAQEFLEKSLANASCTVYLLRLNFLGSQKRAAFWQQHPPTHLFVLSRRPSFTGNGTDATEYAWFVWDAAGYVARAPGVYVI
jgi:hypothetical protein